MLIWDSVSSLALDLTMYLQCTWSVHHPLPPVSGACLWYTHRWDERGHMWDSDKSTLDFSHSQRTFSPLLFLGLEGVDMGIGGE